MKLMIAVSHLLGTGHLARGLILARAFQDAGCEVRVVSGGIPAPQLNPDDVPLVQLPPVRSDGVNFARLLDEQGDEASEAVFAARKDLLVSTLQRFQPDVLITELFPFGRGSLRAEFLALLEAAERLPLRPMICASVRDILEPPSSPKKAARAEDWMDRFYDAVLVHGDAERTPLEATWPVTPAMKPKLHYTGFVAPPPAPAHPGGLGRAEVIVTAGGGAVGDGLFKAALGAADQSDHTWRLLVGGKNAAARIASLSKNAPANAIVEPTRPEFRGMLHHARASVSMCGYNTAQDLLQSGCPAVLVPFDEGGESEQAIRARALAKEDGIEVVMQETLTPQTLLAAVATVTASPRRKPVSSAMDGAAMAVEIVRALREGLW